MAFNMGWLIWVGKVFIILLIISLIFQTVSGLIYIFKLSTLEKPDICEEKEFGIIIYDDLSDIKNLSIKIEPNEEFNKEQRRTFGPSDKTEPLRRIE